MSDIGPLRRAATLLVFLLLPGNAVLAADWLQLLPAGLKAGDQFGSAIAIDQGFIAVGAYLSDTGAGKDSGAIYLKGENGAWSTLTGHAGGEWFGFDLAIDADGKWLLVGAPSPGRGPGSVYLYQVACLKDNPKPASCTAQPLAPSNASPGDEFGSSVAVEEMNGNVRVAVGARGAARRAGRVHVFNNGVERPPISSPESEAGREFGQSIALSGKTLVVGEPLPGEDGRSSGAVYIYKESSNGYELLEISPPGDLPARSAFGYAVAARGDRILAGGPLANQEAGAVYRLDGAAWTRLTATGNQKGDQLGVAVALSETEAVIGARGAKGGAGEVYLNSSSDNLLAALGSPAQGKAEFGFGVAIRGDVIVAGAFKEFGTGAAYMRELGPQKVTLRIEALKDTVQDQGEFLLVPEGSSVDAQIVLEADGGPLRSPVTVDLTVDSQGAGFTDDDYDPSGKDSVQTIRFEAGMAQQKVQVPIRILSDCLAEDEERFSLSLSKASGAQIEDPDRLQVRIEDAGLVKGIEVIPTQPEPWTTSESDVSNRTSKSFSVRLTCQPADKVELKVTSTEIGEGRVKAPSPPRLEFTSDNWNIGQFVTVQGQNDNVCDGTQKYNIKITPTSIDSGYAEVIQEFENKDDDGTSCPTVVLIGNADVCAWNDNTVRYTVRIQNTGDADANGVLLSTSLPDEMRVVLASADKGAAAVDYAQNAVDWKGKVPKHSMATIEIFSSLEPDVQPETAVLYQGAFSYDGREVGFEVSFTVGEAPPCIAVTPE